MKKIKKLISKFSKYRWPIIIIFCGLLALILSQSPRQAQVDFSDAPYRDARQPISVRVEDLLSRMTTVEKIGQMALVEKNSIWVKSDITRYGLGALLSGGGAKPNPNTPPAWLNMVNKFQSYALNTRLGIPLLYGIDAVHGNTNIPGATVFPHNIGLGASGDADLVRRIGVATAQEMLATGIQWNFAPSLDVVQDTRWGRTYETYGANTKMVGKLGAAFLDGLMMPQLGSASVIGTAKHYLGNGAMVWGTSTTPGFKIDQGAIQINEKVLRASHLPPFVEAIKVGVNSVMVGHATWDGTELAANQYLLTDVLKGELGFQGFVVSDWYGVYEISGGKYKALVAAINAGVDMVMLPYDYKNFITYVSQAVRAGDISETRLNDAVRRILTAKFQAGLFDEKLADASGLSEIGSAEHRAVAREAVRKSLVLLKNQKNILPLNKNIARVIVAGSSAHNLGRQSGGWTVEWQGIDGNWINGTTILDGIKNAVSKNTTVEYNLKGDFDTPKKLAEVGIAVVGEAPYAEGAGDNEHPALTKEDLATIAKVKAASKKIIVIIVSGRPLDIRVEINNWDAVLAAWLPGSEGAGVADGLFGDAPFTAKLPVPWPL